MSLIQYHTAEIEDAGTQLQAAYQQTLDNHQRSLQCVAANAEGFGGQGSAGFQEAVGELNAAYSKFCENILALQRVLGVANTQMTETDVHMGSQYSGGISV